MKSKQNGFSLLEVLVAWSMLSLLLASALLLQLKDTRLLRHAYQRTIAATQLFSMLEQLKVIPLAQRQQALTEWNQKNLLLPQAKGQYHCPSNVYCWSELQWGAKPFYHLSMGKQTS